jgi:hypothetical protein
MAIDERARHDLYQRLEQTIGTDATETLMGYLPPVGWADVVTKHDLVELERRMDLRFEAMDYRFQTTDQRIEATEHRILRTLERETGRVRSELLGEIGALRGEMVSRTFLFALFGVFFTALSLMLAVLKLA